MIQHFSEQLYDNRAITLQSTRWKHKKKDSSTQNAFMIPIDFTPKPPSILANAFDSLDVCLSLWQMKANNIEEGFALKDVFAQHNLSLFLFH